MYKELFETIRHPHYWCKWIGGFEDRILSGDASKWLIFHAFYWDWGFKKTNGIFMHARRMPLAMATTRDMPLLEILTSRQSVESEPDHLT